MSAGRKNNSNKKDWNTPPKYIEVIKKFFGGQIYLDPCDNKYSFTNSVISYFEKGLEQSWNASTIFVNPPFGRNNKNITLYDWIVKGKDTFIIYQNEILYLIPVATNTTHFKEIIFKYACGICFLQDTRLKFWDKNKEIKKGAPMACCFVYFGKDYNKFENIFKEYGKCFKI